MFFTGWLKWQAVTGLGLTGLGYYSLFREAPKPSSDSEVPDDQRFPLAQSDQRALQHALDKETSNTSGKAWGLKEE